MVYPTFLAAVAENTHPQDRAKSIGVFRLWRDLGYAIGAIFTGLIADLFSINAAIFFIGILTAMSSVTIRLRMSCGDMDSIRLFTRPPGGKKKSAHHDPTQFHQTRCLNTAG
jgi:MFS family permease